MTGTGGSMDATTAEFRCGATTVTELQQALARTAPAGPQTVKTVEANPMVIDAAIDRARRAGRRSRERLPEGHLPIRCANIACRGAPARRGGETKGPEPEGRGVAGFDDVGDAGAGAILG
jgi:hypothetical protein